MHTREEKKIVQPLKAGTDFSLDVSAQKTYFLWVLGCQMNKSDAQRIESVLELMGMRKAQNESEANLIGVVSCSVRQKAIDKISSRIHLWNEMRKTRPILTLLTGCVLPHDKKYLGKKFDILLDLNELSQLPVEVSRFPDFAKHAASAPRLDEFSDYFSFTPSYHEKHKAFVPIMSGCDKFCTYCAVPYTRGRERSRKVSDIRDEIRKLAVNGCLEVTLLGQNVNSYRAEDSNDFSKANPYTDAFAALLWEINQIDGIERIHFTAPHPRDMTDEVISALTLPKHLNFVHLPMQAGDNDILAKMNRKYTIEDFLVLVEKIRKQTPDIAIGTDIIVGFCSETGQQFERTVAAYKAIEFDISYHAVYSSRKGTVEEKLWSDDISLPEKKRRWKVLQDLMEEITYRKNQKFFGKVVSVLVDSFENGTCIGNSREYKQVRFSSDRDLTGSIIDVKITEPKTWVLLGERV